MPRTTFVLSSVLALSLSVAAQDHDGWHVLFDGKSLDGWRANENPDSFKLDGGKLVVKGPRGHLFYEGPVAGAEFENFILEAEIQTKPKANSGLFFHTKHQPSGWPAHGYEAQVNTTHGDRIKTGSIYAVRNVTTAHSKDGQWFTMRIEVRRRNIIIKIDGKTVVDYDEPADVGGTRKLSKGTFAIQAHDPGSEVWYRKIRVQFLPSVRPGMSRAELQQLKKPGGKWWDRMDYGPFVSSSVGVGRGNRHVALKGITVPIDAEGDGSMTFDTDLLRMAVGWNGGLRMKGVTYDGSHGGHPYSAGPEVFHTRALPGWGYRGDLDDPREIPHGPIPDARGRYRGLYRHGDRVVFAYDVDGTRIHEMPEMSAGSMIRNLEVGASKREHVMVVADAEGDEDFEISHGGRAAVMRKREKKISAPTEGTRVVIDRTEGDWDRLAPGAPSTNDALRSGLAIEATTGWVRGMRGSPRAGSGTEDGRLPRINDGRLPRNQDEPANVTFFDGGRARMFVDLKKSRRVRRVNTYSWHKSDRAPQRFTLWGAPGDEQPGMKGDLSKQGWTKIATVDTHDLGQGGKHASSVDAAEGELGHFRYLLWDLRPGNRARQGCFIAEIDVWTGDLKLPPLKTPSHERGRNPLMVTLAEGDGVRLEAIATKIGKRLIAKIPASDSRTSFRVAYTREHESDGASNPQLPQAPDLSAYMNGGPSLYPEVITVKGKLSDKDDKPWVVDDVPVPMKNPWDSSMRIGGLDLFSNGTSAAVSTWNGDVWIVSGLDDDLDQVRWRRYATGLFETLGLRIVDDVIYVNGKDQITRLHDLDRDGEADFYECFNNDVMTTRNFHEFTFDLQTDPEGNFYIAKGAPVRGGGRGFEKIVPHHGTVMKISKDGSKLEVYSRGMRAPNGIGVGPDGQVTCGDNEGTWVPHCKLHWLEPGSFQGVIDVAGTKEPPTDYNKPLCWFPMEVDNSSGGQVWVPNDERWGPYGGDLLHLSYGKSSIYKVMKETVDGQIQGGVFRIPVNLGSSAMRGRFNQKDGQLWVVGLRGWQTNAARLTALQRVRRTKAPVALPKRMRVTDKGVYVTFTCDLDAELANDVESYSASWWNYVWSRQYGSPEVSADNPDPKILDKARNTELHGHKQHDTVVIKAAKLLDDGRTVFLEIPSIKPVMQMHLKIDLESTDGKEIALDIWNTINKLGRDTGN